MKVGVSSYSFGRYRRATGASLFDVCRKAKEIGFDAIEFISLDGEDPLAQAAELRALCFLHINNKAPETASGYEKQFLSNPKI